MPELVAKGPIIPVSLINELDSGKAVFFCGAGVSAGPGSKLPGFADLVKHVYDAHHIVPDAVEREALDLDEQNPDRRRPNFDKALDLLERPKRLGTRALRHTVIKCLATSPTGSLDIHKALIALSRSERGVRLVTTNFDNRFVEAGLDERFVDVAPKLPVPKPHNWSSLVHLHGRIFPDDDGSNLVLTAADFGRAYLTEQWAARFVTELFREFIVVFVGYSISDPVMSYIVDALAAERAKGARFAMAYAFADHDGTDTGCQKARDGWLAKNVEPILYDKRNNHGLLCKTLAEWVQIRSDPYQARSRIALNEMSKLPDGPNDPVVERVTWALRDPVAARALADAPPVVDEDDFPKVEGWLEVFAEKGLLRCVAADANSGAGDQDIALAQLVGSGFQSRDPQTLDMTRWHLARWMARHLHVPQLLAWVLRNGGYLHPGLRREVQDRLTDRDSDIPISPRLRLLWTVLSNHEPTDYWRYLRTADRYSAAASESERRRIEDEAIQSIAPRLVVRLGPAPRQYSGENPKPILPIDAWGHLKLRSGDECSWPQIERILKDTSVLSRHAETLTGYLDQALTLMEDDDDAYPYSFLYRPSIAAHEQNRDCDAWTCLIDLARDSYFTLAVADPARGDNLLRRWALSGRSLFKRLALHALTENNKSDIQLAKNLLVAGRKPGVWEQEMRHEVLRFFRLAGSSLPPKLRAKVVRTIHDGPKAKPPKTVSNYADRVRYEKALRLKKLSISGARLDKKSRELAEEVGSDVGSEFDEYNEFSVWFEESGLIREEEFAPKDLLDGSMNDVATALENGRINHDGIMFRGFVLAQPFKAAFALRCLSKRGKWPEMFWREFLWLLTRLREKPKYNSRLHRYVALLLSNAPDKLFSEVDSAAAGFVKELAEDYEIDQESELEILWTKAWGGVGTSRPGIVGLSDPLTIAMNHAAGKLAEAALIRLRKYEPEVNKGLPQLIHLYFDTIVDDPNGKFGRVILATRLYNLFMIDRDWVGEHLLPLLSLRSSEEARDLWSAYGWSLTVGPDLLLAFKESFFEILRDKKEGSSRKGNLMRLFITICLEAPNELTEKEIHGVVGSVSEKALETMLDSLRRRLKGNSAEQAKIWHARVYPWLQNYWPTAAVRNTAATSEMMLCMLVECGDAFEDAAAWSLPYLRPVKGHGLYRLDKNGYAEQHPDSMLQVLDRVVVSNGFSVHNKIILGKILDVLRTAKSDVTADTRFQRLYGIATQ